MAWKCLATVEFVSSWQLLFSLAFSAWTVAVLTVCDVSKCKTSEEWDLVQFLTTFPWKIWFPKFSIPYCKLCLMNRRRRKSAAILKILNENRLFHLQNIHVVNWGTVVQASPASTKLDIRMQKSWDSCRKLSVKWELHSTRHLNYSFSNISEENISILKINTLCLDLLESKALKCYVFLTKQTCLYSRQYFPLRPGKKQTMSSFHVHW